MKGGQKNDNYLANTFGGEGRKFNKFQFYTPAATILAGTWGLSVLSAFLILLEVINTVIKDEKIGQWISALIDPSTLLDVISIGQNTGVESIWPLFCF